MKHAVFLTALLLSLHAGAQEKTIQLGNGEPPQAVGTVDAGVFADRRAPAIAPAAAPAVKADIPLIGGPASAPGKTAKAASVPESGTSSAPVAVYTTMKDAAAAGVNPLNPPEATPAPRSGAAPLSVVEDNLGQRFMRQPLAVKLGALFAVLAGVGALAWLRRRNG